ncbi:MAG: hypothetical protein KDB46_09595 [Solirubrobacterales bacterium]|nr:hypothetical protein [Solirubrobacterales bacterium]
MPKHRRPLLVAVAGVVVLAAATAIAWAAGAFDSDDGRDRLPTAWQRGMNLTAFLPNAYSDPKATEAIATAERAGTDLVALTPTYYMASADASTVTADPTKTPTDESILDAAAEARAQGLRVAIKPHVDVLDGTFRGEIRPADRAAWFESYGELVDRLSALARRADADVFVIGTELTSMATDADAWRDLIGRARRNFDGEITFAANWPEGAAAIAFWDRLDYIGIDAYMPLETRDRATPEVAALVRAWRDPIAQMRQLHEKWRLPVLLTELGYESRPGTAARVDGQGVDQRAQADAYEAAFRSLSPLAWVAGIWWWEWSAERIGSGADDTGFNPEGKEAEQVLRSWQAG